MAYLAHRTWLAVAVFSCYALWSCYAINSITTISGVYELEWYTATDNNTLCINVKIPSSSCDTSCWVGFGIGEATSGGMGGADLVVAQLSSGGVFLRDMHATGETTPSDDVCQDWQLKSFSISSKFQVEMCRSLNTADGQDREIIAHTGDPKESFPCLTAFGSGSLNYHSANRQVVNLPLLASEAEYTTSQNSLQALLDNPNIITIELKQTSPEMVGGTQQLYTIPVVETTYLIRDYDFSSFLDDTWQIIAFEPLFASATEKFVHHFVVNFGGINLYAWAGEKSGFLLPDDVGFSLSGVTSNSVLRLQYHYDNPGGITNLQDDSGVRLYITKVPRVHEAGMMQLGDGRILLDGKQLPAGINSIDFTCRAECLQQELTVFGAMMHTHAFGIAVLNEHINSTGDVVTDPLFGRSEYYDSELQRTIPMRFSINAGDSIKTSCIYDVPQSIPVVSDLDSDEEMCIMFVMYYPKQQSLNFCDWLGDCAAGQNPVFPTFKSVSESQFRLWPNTDSTCLPTSSPTTISAATGLNLHINLAWAILMSTAIATLADFSL